MPHIQAWLNPKESEEFELFLLLKKHGKWTKQKTIVRAVLEYIRKPVPENLKPKQGEQHE